jgi:hypothetical protein
MKPGSHLTITMPNGTVVELTVTAVHPLVVTPPPAPAPEQAGYTISEWCEKVGISRTAEWQLPADEKPRSVHVGRRRIVTESPRDWLIRRQR